MSDNMDEPEFELDRTGDQGEIIERIVEEHHRGGHVTGPVAGCAICAKFYAPEPDPAPVGRYAIVPVASTPADLARLRILQTPPPPMDDEIVENIAGIPQDADGPGMRGEPGPEQPPDGMTPIEYARQLKAQRNAAPDDEPTLSEVALQEAEAALIYLRDRGGASPGASAQVEATVGIVRAIVALTDALEKIVSRLELLDRPEPPAAA